MGLGQDLAAGRKGDRVLGEGGKRTRPGRTGRALGGGKGFRMGPVGTGRARGGERGLGWDLSGQVGC